MYELFGCTSHGSIHTNIQKKLNAQFINAIIAQHNFKQVHHQMCSLYTMKFLNIFVAQISKS